MAATRGRDPADCGGAARWLRAASVAAAVLGLGAGGHTAAGGGAPEPERLVALAVLVTVVARAGLPRRVGRLLFVGWLAAGQVGVHAALAHLAAGHGAAAGHGHGTHGLGVGSAAGSGWGMALAHAAAAVGVGLWLAAGERALWRLVELGVERYGAHGGGVVRRAVLLLLAARDAAAPRAAVRASLGGWVEPPVLVTAVSPRSLPRRGPPHLSCP